MLEFIKHALGICGEHWHPNIWTALLSGAGLTGIGTFAKLKLTQLKIYKNGR